MAKKIKSVDRLVDELDEILTKIETGDVYILDGILETRDTKAKIEGVLKKLKEKENDYLFEIREEAAKYGGKYKGLNFIVSSRETLSFKGIPEVEDLETQISRVKEKYKQAYKAAQKNVINVHLDDEQNPYWIGENGEKLPFPEVQYSAASLTIKK